MANVSLGGLSIACDDAAALNTHCSFLPNKDVSAPGAYSFSMISTAIFGGRESTLIIDVGKISHVPNEEPYDPSSNT